MRTWVDVAELTNTKTLNGGLVARSASGLPLLLREGMEVAFVPPVLDAPRRACVEAVQETGADSAVVRLSGIADIEAAAPLVGCHCLVRRAELPRDSLRLAAPLWDGWSVVDVSAGLVGEVAGVEDRPAQPLLLVRPSADANLAESRAAGNSAAAATAAASAVRGAERTVLIPLVDEFVVSVDEQARVITVDVPAGLLDL